MFHAKINQSKIPPAKFSLDELIGLPKGDSFCLTGGVKCQNLKRKIIIIKTYSLD